MGTIKGVPLLPFGVLVTEVWNIGKDTNHHMALVDHVKMNSWWKFGECSTHRYCNIDLYISF